MKATSTAKQNGLGLCTCPAEFEPHTHAWPPKAKKKFVFPASRVEVRVTAFTVVCPGCGFDLISGNEAEWTQAKTVHCSECHADVTVPHRKIEKLFK